MVVLSFSLGWFAERSHGVKPGCPHAPQGLGGCHTGRPAKWGQGSDERCALSNLSVPPDSLMRMPPCIPPPPETHLLPLQRSLRGSAQSPVPQPRLPFCSSSHSEGDSDVDSELEDRVDGVKSWLSKNKGPSSKATSDDGSLKSSR